MSIQITIKKNEILKFPNDTELGKYVREKFYHEEYIEDNSYDKCVICGKETPYTKNTHIDNRVGYVTGIGQTCYQHNICES